MNAVVTESDQIREHYELDVIPLRYARSLGDIGRPTFRKALQMCGHLLHIARHALFRRPDAVYYTISPTGWALIRDLCYVTLLKILGIRIVYHIHGSGIAASAQSPVLRAWLRWAFAKEWIIHLSPSLASELHGLASAARCKVLPNGVRSPSNSAVEATRAGNRILFCSNMMAEKGPLVLVEALGRLARKNIEFTAEFAGPPTAPEFEARFWNVCRREGVVERVRWRGAHYGQEKAALFSSASIFAFPTYYPPEGVPLVLLEAMSYGLATIASDQGGIRDILEDGLTGFIVPPKDVDSLTLKLETLLLDEQLRESMGASARRAFAERYTLDRFERGWLGIMNEALPC